jgi:hypothetical protein
MLAVLLPARAQRTRQQPAGYQEPHRLLICMWTVMATPMEACDTIEKREDAGRRGRPASSCGWRKGE